MFKSKRNILAAAFVAAFSFTSYALAQDDLVESELMPGITSEGNSAAQVFYHPSDAAKELTQTQIRTAVLRAKLEEQQILNEIKALESGVNQGLGLDISPEMGFNQGFGASFDQGQMVDSIADQVTERVLRSIDGALLATGGEKQGEEGQHMAVEMIYGGRGQAMQALININGVLHTVSSGTNLLDVGVKVLRVNSREVLIEHNGREIALSAPIEHTSSVVPAMREIPMDVRHDRIIPQN